ncbi:MAG: 4-(cytidine 5'-diphospho)-2-C-methyl-D-erythritol kinase [Planctomycetota bacterium]
MTAPRPRFPLLRIVDSDHGATVRTPAKINLFLEILGRRPDGFHELVTLLHAVDFYDTVSLRTHGAGSDSLVVSGRPVPAGPENLVLRAVARVRRDFDIPPLALTLEKQIPIGAGLGGGSGNAAGTLALLAHRFALPGGADEWAQRAADLGSDVPFFLGDGVAVARGRGERLEDLAGPFLGGDDPFFVLLLPNRQSDTASAYRGLSLTLTCSDGPISFNPRAFLESQRWVTSMFNRLESSVWRAHPDLATLANWLERAIGQRWRMTGSGSAFFGVCFDANEALGLCRQVVDHFRGGPLQVDARVVRGLDARTSLRC